MIYFSINNSKSFSKTVLILLLIVFSNLTNAQEWKNIKKYKQETGNIELKEGNWLRKDRKKKTDVWFNANVYNLKLKNGFNKYKSISEIRDFYYWYNNQIIKKNKKIKWFGITAIVSNQLSKLDNLFIRIFIVRNNEAVVFANQGASKVFEFAFPQMKEIYFSEKIMNEEQARAWDLNFGKIEQCKILEPLYMKMSDKCMNKLDRMAKGKGLYRIGVPKEIRFTGDISDCNSRYDHAVNKLLPYYLNKTNN